MESDFLNILDSYVEEFKEDFNFSQLNINDVAFKIIKIKHKWLERLIRAKKDLIELEKMKIEAIEKVALKISKESTVPVSIPNAEKMALKHEKIKKVVDVIEHQKLLIEYLERIEKISRDSGFDIKNIVDLIKIENL